MTSIQQIWVETSDGCRLEADLLQPEAGAVGGIVVAHPHPLYGGNRNHPIVTSLTDAAAAARYITLRFDFRGTGHSTGTHGNGLDEINDMDAALELVASMIPDGSPLIAAGYSFGGAMALGATDPRITHRIGVAAPLAMLAAGIKPTEPTLLIVPRHDQYTSPDNVAQVVSVWPSEPTVEVIEAADHFLLGFATEVAKRAITWLSSTW